MSAVAVAVCTTCYARPAAMGSMLCVRLTNAPFLGYQPFVRFTCAHTFVYRYGTPSLCKAFLICYLATNDYGLGTHGDT